MICEKCRKEIPEDSISCPFCGQEIPVKQEEPPVQAEEMPTQPDDTLSQLDSPVPEDGPGGKKKSRKLKIGIIIAAVAVVIAIAVPVTLTAVREYNYKEAVSLMKKEKYEQAKKKFTKLDDYKNSKKNIKECNTGIAYEEAAALVDEEDYEKALSSLEDLAKAKYKNSADLKKLCENKLAYNKAQTLLDSKKYYEAYSAFMDILDFEDASEKAKSCVQPMPATGELYRNEAYAGTTCPIEISRTGTSEKLPLVLKITTSDDVSVATVFLAAGEGYTINLPAGSYKITGLIGMMQWFGTEDMFGDMAFERQLNSGENDGLYVLQDNYTYTLSL